jgi:hypothetical protein
VWSESQTLCAEVAVTVAVNPTDPASAELLDYRVTAGHSHGPPAAVDAQRNAHQTYYVLAGDTPVLVHNTGGSCAVGLPGDPYDPAAVAARQSEWDSLRIDLNGRAARADTPYPAPISRIDAPNTNITGSQWHAQERGQGAPGINMDGTPKDTNVLPRWPRAALDFLRKYGWNVWVGRGYGR